MTARSASTPALAISQLLLITEKLQNVAKSLVQLGNGLSLQFLAVFARDDATGTYRVDFELSVSWLVDASVSDIHESARSDISLLLASLSGGVLFELVEFADTLTGDGADGAATFRAPGTAPERTDRGGQQR